MTYLPRQKLYSCHRKGWGLWHCSVTRTNEFIGWILSRPMDFFTKDRDDQTIELGWRFVQSSWGKGFASEAALKIAHHIEQIGGISRISAIADPENRASINIMKKLGMNYQKTAIHEDPLGNTCVVYYSRDLEKDIR